MKSRPVLLVEDDPDIQENLRAFLELEGYGVASAFNGLEALEYLRAQRPVSIVLLDLMMPVMDGYEFLLRYCDEKPDPTARTPIVVLSAASDVEKISDKCQVQYLKKPFDLDRLLSVIEASVKA